MRFSNFRDLHDVYPKIREKKLFRSEAPFDFQKKIGMNYMILVFVQ